MQDFGIKWLEPWEPAIDGEKLVAELHRGLCPTHPLYGRRAELLGRRPGSGGGDFLFHLPDGPQPFAFVHQTWTVESDVEFPRTNLFASVSELQERLRHGNQRWLASAESSK